MAKQLDVGALVKKHNGLLKAATGDQLVCEDKRYHYRSVWDDADDADAFSDAVLAAGKNIDCANDWVKGVYTMWFTVS